MQEALQIYHGLSIRSIREQMTDDQRNVYNRTINRV